MFRGRERRLLIVVLGAIVVSVLTAFAVAALGNRRIHDHGRRRLRLATSIPRAGNEVVLRVNTGGGFVTPTTT